MFEVYRKEIKFGGEKLIFETGKVARQADGAVIVTYEGTTVLCTATAAKNNSESGEEINLKLSKINKLLFLESNPIPVKFALNLMGIIDKGIRLPLTWLDEKFHQDIQNELKNLELI